MKRTLVMLALLAGCNDAPGTQVRMAFDRAHGLYDAPFPSDDLIGADGRPLLDKFPNPNAVSLIDQGLTLLKNEAHGFATSSSILIPLTAALDPAHLPDLAGSTAADASVYLTSVTPGAPDLLQHRPIKVGFMADGGAFGAPNLLAILPLQGVPLRPKAIYAAVVTTRALDAKGHALQVSPSVTTLLAGGAPAGLSADVAARYRAALGMLPSKEVAGLTVFTTDDPIAPTVRFRDDALTHGLPSPLSAPTKTDTFPDYCVYQTTVSMPVYQGGTPPYTTSGGGWVSDASGAPMLQRMETASLFLTVPRSAMPAAGYPVTVFVRQGGGGDRPLVDRGPQAMTGGPPITPGTGPALYFARAGFAGVQVDGPLGGLRNTTHADEQFLIFNVMNAAALRDNVRQSALELSLMARALPSLTFDASDCPGAATQVRYDVSHLALMGHSTGAWIAPLALAIEPAYRAGLLSGAGGSWIENIIFKLKPVAVRPLAEILLDYNMDQRDLTELDPALTIVQWGAEPADSQVYVRAVIDEPLAGAQPRHMLMMQGIVDHYILPQIANSTSLGMGLDLAGPALDEQTPELASMMALGPLLTYSGHAKIALPASGNRMVGGTPITAIVTQNPGDNIEDGHEVVFQTDPPKHEYRCFLTTWLAGGVPKVPQGMTADSPCP
jgi:hypothetical protein